MHQYQVKQSKTHHSPLGACSLQWRTGEDRRICQRFVAGGEEYACLPVGRLPVKSAGKREYTFSNFSFFRNVFAVLTISPIILTVWKKNSLYSYIQKRFSHIQWRIRLETPQQVKDRNDQNKGNPKGWEITSPPWIRTKIKTEHTEQPWVSCKLMERFSSVSATSICKMRIRLHSSHWRTYTAEKKHGQFGFSSKQVQL